MSQDIYFKPVEGIGVARTGATAEEKRRIEADQKDREIRARAEFVRQQYAKAEETLRVQEARGDRSNAVANLATIFGAGAVVTNAADEIAEGQKLQELFDRSAQYNAIETPIVNQWSSQSAKLANNPYRDQQLLSAMIGPNGEQRFTDASQAQDYFRHQALLAAIYKHYQVNDLTQKSIEQHLQTAREVIENLFPSDQNLVANKKINTEINPSRTSQGNQREQLVHETLDLRITLQESVTKAAQLAGVQEQQAKQLGAEVAAAFVREQALRDQILLDLKEEQVRVQNNIKEVATKLQAAKEAEQQRVESGDLQSRPHTNLDPSAVNAIEQARRQGVELDPSGATKDPTVFQDGAYLDPNRKLPEQEVEKPEIDDKLAPIDARVAAFDADGNPTNDHTKIDSLGAELGQAADYEGVRRGQHAAPVSTIERNGSIDRIDGLQGPRFGPINPHHQNN